MKISRPLLHPPPPTEIHQNVMQQKDKICTLFFPHTQNCSKQKTSLQTNGTNKAATFVPLHHLGCWGQIKQALPIPPELKSGRSFAPHPCSENQLLAAEGDKYCCQICPRPLQKHAGGTNRVIACFSEELKKKH